MNSSRPFSVFFAIAGLASMPLLAAILAQPAAAENSCENPGEIRGQGVEGVSAPLEMTLVDRVVAGEEDWWWAPDIFFGLAAVELVSFNGPLALMLGNIVDEEQGFCGPPSICAMTSESQPVVRCAAAQGTRIGVQNASPFGLEIHYALRILGPDGFFCEVACIRTPLVSKVSDVSLAENPEVPGAGDAIPVDIERGRLRVDVGLTFVEQQILVAQVNGFPSTDSLNLAAGPVTSTYTTLQHFTTVSLPLVEDPEVPPENKIGELWSARLQIPDGDGSFTDVPFVMFVPSA